MKTQTLKLTTLLVAGTMSALPLHADLFTTITAATAGNDWSTVGAGWSSGAGATAGNDYEALSGALVRSPRNSGPTVAFPGNSLQIDAGAAMRFKTGDIGTTTTFVFNDGGLILNGGQAQAGDAINSVVSGTVHVVAASSLTTSGPGGVLDTPGHAAADTRTFSFTANVDGSGTLTLMNGKTTIANPSGNGLPDFSFTGNNSSFSGGFTNVGGWLQVAGIGSLGSGNVTISGFDNLNQAVFNSTIDLVSGGTLTLSNLNSGLILDNNLTFAAVSIDGTSLAPGAYTVADLTTLGFGANIAGGSDPTKVLTVVGAVPEPATVALLSTAGLAMLVFRRKRSAR
jgi:hypothetical protein